MVLLKPQLRVVLYTKHRLHSVFCTVDRRIMLCAAISDCGSPNETIVAIGNGTAARDDALVSTYYTFKSK